VYRGIVSNIIIDAAAIREAIRVIGSVTGCRIELIIIIRPQKLVRQRASVVIAMSIHKTRGGECLSALVVLTIPKNMVLIMIHCMESS